ncbi:hypothetical protein PIB30_024773 [Stylosanthes scabra]|uniref:TOD1/MUCI70 glycosyltransferase-like domain-containing protein n=1 Tax=Stylosanthes scabra TaxID=79078 RepID=A0ABU6U9T8_9FABA|nr:hypothetical protein [Stylosanthes scabra]
MESRFSATHSINEELNLHSIHKELNLQETVLLPEVGKPPPKSRRRKHYPCEVEFLNSVDGLAEPKNYMNFTWFSLDYVKQEGETSDTGLFEPRFGGHQTLEEREKSFYARNQTVHCGFVKGSPGYSSTGFDLDEKDKAYMSKCKIAVSCIFGSSDFLRRPTSRLISQYAKDNVCFVIKMRLNADPILIIEYFLWRRNAEFAISNHYDRHCVWDEVIQNKRLNKYNHTAIDEQFYFYQSDGLTKFDPSNPNNPLPSYVPEGSFIEDESGETTSVEYVQGL